MKRYRLFLSVFLAAISAASALAAVSRLINFQGRLTDTSGNPITTSTTLVFKLYGASSGGAALFTEPQNVTPDADGLYSVNIGDVSPLAGVDFSGDLWLEVTVNGEVLPGRYRLTPAPYAVYASQAASVEDGSVTSAAILNGEIVNADVSASADIAPSKINGGAFQNEAYSFPAGAVLGGSTVTAAGNLQLPSGATITVGSVTGTLLPSGTMVLSVNACPAGFTEYTSARGFYLAGVPAGGTAGGTVGTAMTDLSDSAHSHSISAATASNTSTALGAADRVVSVTTPTGGVNRGDVAPYIQVRLCAAP